MGLLSWIVLGGLAGWVANMFAGSGARLGIVTNIVLGIVGAFVGGWIFSYLGGRGVTGFNLYSFGVAFAGAAVVLVLARLLRR
ncbi:MAG: GlsB/YeaQ/YmgE family stress response membrane protein [Myxococcaceae bacterium]